jgi:hypothetical protein
MVNTFQVPYISQVFMLQRYYFSYHSPSSCTAAIYNAGRLSFTRMLKYIMFLHYTVCVWQQEESRERGCCTLFYLLYKCMDKMVKLFLCSTIYALRHEGIWVSGCREPQFLDLGTSWRWAVRITTRPLCPRGKSPRYPLDRRLGEPQSRSGRCCEEKILYLSATRTPASQSPST